MAYMVFMRTGFNIHPKPKYFIACLDEAISVFLTKRLVLLSEYLKVF